MAQATVRPSGFSGWFNFLYGILENESGNHREPVRLQAQAAVVEGCAA
jgi:hypothetical protein